MATNHTKLQSCNQTIHYSFPTDAGKNKPSKPSYPVPEGPSSGPSSGPGSASAPGAGGSPSWGSREPEDNGSDRGGYGTINAWFPFMFSGGFPNGGDGPRPAAPRGDGAPNPGPAPGSDSRPPAYGGPSPTAGPQGGHGGSPSNSGECLSLSACEHSLISWEFLQDCLFLES